MHFLEDLKGILSIYLLVKDTIILLLTSVSTLVSAFLISFFLSIFFISLLFSVFGDAATETTVFTFKFVFSLVPGSVLEVVANTGSDSSSRALYILKYFKINKNFKKIKTVTCYHYRLHPLH